MFPLQRTGTHLVYIYIVYYELVCVYIYILYIMSSGLLITRVSLGQTLQFGRAGPGLVVYKKRPEVLGFSFSCPISIY
jgi:hypothetical protein